MSQAMTSAMPKKCIQSASPHWSFPYNVHLYAFCVHFMCSVLLPFLNWLENLATCSRFMVKYMISHTSWRGMIVNYQLAKIGQRRTCHFAMDFSKNMVRIWRGEPCTMMIKCTILQKKGDGSTADSFCTHRWRSIPSPSFHGMLTISTSQRSHRVVQAAKPLLHTSCLYAETREAHGTAAA